MWPRLLQKEIECYKRVSSRFADGLTVGGGLVVEWYTTSLSSFAP